MLDAYIKAARTIERQSLAEGGGDLVGSHLMLPVRIAARMLRERSTQGHDKQALWDDMIGVGNLALVRAAAQFNSKKGTFKAYAGTVVRNAIELALNRWFTGGQSKALESHWLIGRATKKRLDANEPIDPAAIAEETGIGQQTVVAVLNLASGYMQLDAKLRSVDGETIGTFADMLVSPDDVEEEALKAVVAEERQELQNALQSLSKKYRITVGLTVGYPSFEAATIGEIMDAVARRGPYVARKHLRAAFQGGQADAGKLGYAPDDATGTGRRDRLVTPAARAGNRDRQVRDSAEDLWRRVADRWRQARLDTA